MKLTFFLLINILCAYCAALPLSQTDVQDVSSTDFESNSVESSEEDFDEDDEFDGLVPEEGGAYFLNDAGQLEWGSFSGINPAMSFFGGSDKKNIRFFLYTKNNVKPDRLFVDQPLAATYALNSSRPLKVIIHGFLNSYLTENVQQLREAYLNRGDYNVITVDWSRLSQSPNYYGASKATLDVGKYTAKLLQNLIDQKATTLSEIHITGHSLGGHTAAIVGKQLIKNGYGKVSRITALDPALPLYQYASAKWKVSPDDAEFVDVIHTNGGQLGFDSPLGHSDFYPNGGCVQPGCTALDLLSMGACSHNRVWQLFTETVMNENAFPTKECDSLKRAKKGKCNSGRDFAPNMGLPAYKDGDEAIYYTKTRSSSPFSINAI